MLVMDFKDHLDTEKITEAIQRIRQNLKNKFPLFRFVIIQPE